MQYTGGMYKMQAYTITKQISKHGKQAVIVIPKVLEQELPPGTIAEVKITVLKEKEAEADTETGLCANAGVQE